MKTASVHQTKTHLSRMLKEVQAGETIIILNGTKPVARLTAIKRADIYRASELPAHHRDPFDRLLVAAALGATATIVTPDETIHKYPVSYRW